MPARSMPLLLAMTLIASSVALFSRTTAARANPVAPTTDSDDGAAPSAESTRPDWKRYADDKRAIELEIAYAITDAGDLASVTSFQLQPSFLFWRRLTLGTRLTVIPVTGDDAFAGWGFDFYLGYQHYLSKTTVPYLRALIGVSKVVDDDEQEVNFGGEVGVKLYRGRSFYALVAAGSSQRTPVYGLAGVGFGLEFGAGGGDLRAALFVPVIVGLAAALIPWGIDRAVN